MNRRFKITAFICNSKDFYFSVN